MEWEELQKIWDEQNKKDLYTINETAMHEYIQRKIKKTRLMANTSELFIILTYIGCGCVFFSITRRVLAGNFILQLIMGWVFLTAAWVTIRRIFRILGGRKFDRSMLGDLQHAVSTAAYQVRLSLLMRWNMLPMGILVILSVRDKPHAVLIIIGFLLLYSFAFFASKWELGLCKARKRQLVELLNQLSR